MSERALARPTRPTCLLCGGPADESESSLAPGRFRCEVCRSITDGDIAPCPESGSLVLPPVSKPRFMSASIRAPALAPGSPFRRDAAEPGARIVLRWWVRPHGWQMLLGVALMLVGIPIFALVVGPGLDLIGWISVPILYLFAYNLARLFERVTLIVEGGRAELVTRRLPMPRWWPFVLTGRSERRVIRLAEPKHVYLRRRPSDGQAGHEDAEYYYDLVMLDEAARFQLIDGFVDVNEARFVYRALTGFVPALEAASPRALRGHDAAGDLDG